jgi:hypothetical protein
MINEKVYKADINISTTGDNTIIAAPTGTSEFIVVDSINFVPNSAVTVQLKDGSTNYGGAYSLTANQGFTLDKPSGIDAGIITCSANNAFVINLSADVQVSGFALYHIVNR